MRLVSLSALLVGLATTATAFSLNDLANKIAALIHKLEPAEINKLIDDHVQQQLAANANIQRPPLVAKTRADGTLSYRILQVPDLHYTNFDYFPCLMKPDDMKKVSYPYPDIGL